MTDRARDLFLRTGIFAAALLPRAVLSYVTLGAVDAIHDFRNTVRVLENVPTPVPYLPNFDLWVWLGGKIAYYTPLPATFSYKILLVVADALIALLLFDAEPNRRDGVRNGLLYAIAPVPVYIVAIHHSWDSFCLYFLLLTLVLLRARKDAAAGAAFVVSNILKPLSAPLALILLPPAWKRTRAVVAGAVAMVVAYLVLLYAIGRPLTLDDVRAVVRYASGGVQLFGLPTRPHDRLWIVLPVTAAVTALYFSKRVTRDEGVLLFFAATVGLSGLTANYLCWVVPFALLCRRNNFLAIYTAAAGVFLVIYYRSPVLNLTNIDNLGAYGMLRPLGGWTPTLAGERWQDAIRLLGNLVVPLLFLGYAAYIVVRAILRKERVDEPVSPPGTLRYALPAACFAIFIAALLVWAAMKPPLRSAPFIVTIERKIAAYDVVRYRGPGLLNRGQKTWIGRTFLDPRASNPILNLSNVGLAWVLAASAATALWRPR
jgi:hypothetical protein